MTHPENTTPANPAQGVSEAKLPATGAYIERLTRIFRDYPTDDTSSLVLIDYARAALTAAIGAGGTAVAVADEDGSMTAEEIRLEDLKQMAKYDGPIVSLEAKEPYYLASCNNCGWVGSSERCGTDSWGDDSDVYCPRCHASGADCGKVASALSNPPAQPGWRLVPENATVEMVAAFWRQKNAGTQEIGETGGDCSDFAAYRAMLDASPSKEGA